LLGTTSALVFHGPTTILTQVADITTFVATVTTSVADVTAKIPLVPTTLANVLAAFLPWFVVTNLARVLPNLATILPNLVRVATQFLVVATDLAFVRPELARFARRDTRMTRNVWVFDVLCVNERGTSNHQGRSDSSHSEIAHRIPQSRYSALAVVAAL